MPIFAVLGLAFYPLLAAAVVLGGVYVLPARWCTAAIAGVVSSLLILLALRQWAAGAGVALNGGDALGAYVGGLAVAALVLALWANKAQPKEERSA